MDEGPDDVESLRLKELEIGLERASAPELPVLSLPPARRARETDFSGFLLNVEIRTTVGLGLEDEPDTRQEFPIDLLVHDSHTNVSSKDIVPFHLSLDRLHYLIKATNPHLPSDPGEWELGWVYPGGYHAEKAYYTISSREVLSTSVSALYNQARNADGPAVITLFLWSPIPEELSFQHSRRYQDVKRRREDSTKTRASAAALSLKNTNTETSSDVIAEDPVVSRPPSPLPEAPDSVPPVTASSSQPGTPTPPNPELPPQVTIDAPLDDSTQPPLEALSTSTSAIPPEAPANPEESTSASVSETTIKNPSGTPALSPDEADAERLRQLLTTGGDSRDFLSKDVAFEARPQPDQFSQEVDFESATRIWERNNTEHIRAT